MQLTLLMIAPCVGDKTEKKPLRFRSHSKAQICQHRDHNGGDVAETVEPFTKTA
jgi:hypothetical protein